MDGSDTYVSSGGLVVRTVTGGGALPVADATVTVFGSDSMNKEVERTVKTGESGQTPRLTLPAPSAANSRAPGLASPYATYDVLATKEGFFVHQALRVPVFADITAIQTLEMIPRSFGGVASDAPRGVDSVTEQEPFGRKEE